MGDTVNDDQAQRFAQRMIETWPTGPRRNIWADIALKLHDRDAALAAYADLEQTAGHISTALFHTAYQAAKRRRQSYGPPVHCELCAGTGWVDEPGVQLALGDDEIPRSPRQVECRCTRGQELLANGVRRRILEANAR